MFYDVAMNFVIGTILMVAGAIMLCIPNRVFTWILVVSILFLFANGVTLFIRFIKNKKNKNANDKIEKKKSYRLRLCFS